LTKLPVGFDFRAAWPLRKNYNGGNPRRYPARLTPEAPSVATEEEALTIHAIGNYDIVSKIAEGGMGAVYRAKSRFNGDMVAIKVVPAQTAKNKTLLKRFEREFNAAHGIDHVNVVKAIEFCSNVPTPFLVMELVDGDSVGQRIDKAGKFTEEEAKRIIVQVCQGLHRAHKHNLIHRDIKPDNILLAPDGTAKITDLGLVKGLGEEEMNLTRTGRGLGTPHFMAPEQFRDAKNADVRCDVYSVGATMYMMVTGEMPFDGSGPLDCWMKKIRNEFPPPREIVPELSERTNSTILRAMSATPDRRHNNCRDFVEDLLGRSTRPADAAQTPENTELWYLVYKDEIGQSHTVKGTTDGIRKALQEHLLGDAHNIVAAKTKQGPFQPMEKLPEFRDLLLTGGTMSPNTTAQYPYRSEPFPTPDLKSPTTPLPAAGGTTLDYMPAYDGPELPHIQLDRSTSPQTEWILWALACALACITGVALYLRFLK
jgi:eukaryotic-like serine/threonine-protein kinase